MRWAVLLVVFGAGVALVGWAGAQAPDKGKTEKDKKGSGELPPSAGATSDLDVVKRTNAARREYEESLRELRAHYLKVGDKQRVEWAEQELMGFHLMFKPSYNLDVLDAFPPTLEASVNIKEANELFKQAMEYKGKGLGNDYVLNMRRAELLFRELLEKYPNSDKIGDVAYHLAEIYESRAYRQFDRAARYFERSFQWVKGSRTDARLRAAILYDRQLNERTKAIELYRSVVENDVDPERIKIAQRRLEELTGGKK
ncbi:MAG TPA: tetratricopeptide repeat protein [Gemmataceae bacterium]|nr:tetratricopeptide repeat protein [Gemmataceae bacterium]